MEPLKKRPHGAAHSTTAVGAAHALYTHLLPEERHAFANEIFQDLAVDGLDHAHFPDERRKRALRSLSECAAMLGGPPAHDEFVRMRKEHPEYDWLTPGQIIRALAVPGWVAAVQEARLGDVAEPDRVVRELGKEFSEEEVLVALLACRDELGRVPFRREYLSWAHRPEVRTRPGRRPLSDQVFVRMFGGFAEALVAAKIIEPGSDAYLVAYAGKGPRGLTEEEVLASVRFIVHRLAATLGRTPFLKEYLAEVYAIKRAQEETPVRIVSRPTILRHFPGWDAAVKAAGFDPPPQRPVRVPREPHEYESGRRPTWTVDICERAFLGALKEFGPPVRMEKYRAYRIYEIKRDPTRSYDLPGGETMLRVLGDWRLANKRLGAIE